MKSENLDKLRSILLVEDDEDDREFIRIALSTISSSHNLHLANNGQEALDYLFYLPEGAALPCLIILDLNMPILDGVQTLEALNGKPKFEKIPKVILTTSDSSEDKFKCLANGASEYVVKPSNMTGIIKTVETLLKYCN